MSKATYGSARNQGVSGKFIVIGIVIVLIAAGVYVFSQYRNSTSADVTGDAAGYETLSDDAMRMTVDITRDDTDKPGVCIVSALNISKAEAGRREAIVPAGGSETTRLVVDIPTHSRPVGAEVYGCGSTAPSYLDADTESSTD